MKSQETIKLYLYVDGVNDVPFYGDASGVYEDFILANGEVFTTSNGFAFNVRRTNEQIEIGAFRYDAKRMGGAPTISFTLMFEDCLDNFWSNKVYAVFNDEKYFLKQIPTSSLSNEDARYKHTVELISERAILDNVYFFDAVVGNPLESDKAVSNSTKVVFFGSVQEFAKRLNASLEYTKLLKWEDGFNEDGEPIKIANGYNVVVDEGIGSEEKLMSFEDQFFSNVLQEIYNQYQIPYYFVGKTIHIGFSDDVYPHTFSYGVDDALISITKNNANFKIVNRVTGKGSTDNIPYYYPNNSPKGDIEAEVNTTSDNFEVEIIDRDLYADKVDVDSTIERTSIDYVVQSIRLKAGKVNEPFLPNGSIDLDINYKDDPFRFNVEISGQSSDKGEVYFELFLDDFVIYNGDVEYLQQLTEFVVYAESQERSVYGDYFFSGFSPRQATAEITNDINSIHVKLPFTVDGNAEQKLRFKIVMNPFLSSGRFTCKMRVKEVDSDGWVLGEKKIDLKDVGLRSNGLANIGDTITQRLAKYVNTSQNLMPSVYRATDGAERFYNAINYPFLAEEGYELKHGEYLKNEDKDGNQTEIAYVHNDAYKEANGEYIVFKNPYFEGTPKEHSISVEDLKPTIKEAVNSMGLRMDMFSEFAYDLDDNDETEGNDSENSRDFVHSYFFGKLRKLDFNLFEHAIEQQPMTISFTSGDCGACNFEIGVTEEEPQKNPVQVDESGNLIRNPETGNVVCGQFEKVTTFQDRQQDTSKYEVWIALKKEESTYGILMPKAPIDGVGGHRPKACTVNEDGTVNNDGDTFVILGINLPEEYIYRAENKLRDEIIKYIKDNNEEKFSFSITFSRIFFAENPSVLEYLNENSRLNVEYNGKTYTLYVTSYSYNMGEGDVLPEIRVELDDKLTLSQNALQNAINEVKSEVGMAFANFDVLALASPYFLRKDVDDICNGKIDFKKGIKFGEGGKVEVLDNNSAKLTIEYLEVTKKASFTSLEIKEKTHVGGQIIISPAAMTCGEVEELEDSYRCYFQTKNAEGNDEIFNQFAENDLAICQTYNAWGSRYYWRKVVGVGEDYIDLSKTLCDEYSDVPMAGDKIVQLGNTVDITRQSAIVLSAYGDNAPSFIMYNGINDFTLVDKNITGIIWNPKTLEPQMYSYGSFFFGDGTTDENGNLIGENFITFQKRDGDTKKKLHINATVNFSSDSTGLSNLEEWKEVEKDILNLNKTVEKVQDQIDGVIENWSGGYTPTIKNSPVVDWLTKGNDELVAHINDTFINISDGEDGGKAWRWCECWEIDKFTHVDEIYNDIVPSREWYKIGTLDKEKGYTSYGTHGSSGSIIYDTDIQIVIATPTYIRFESATNDVYILDEHGYFESNNLSLKVIYYDYIQVTLQDGSIRFLHWHPISDTDAVNALKEAAEAKYMVNDLTFLKDTFKKGTTTIENGVVMAQMVAVGEGGDNIEAFLNGSDFAEDTESNRGKLILAAGISEKEDSEEGEDGLEERAKKALTRIYEDGTFVSKSAEIEGAIVANKGKIGDFNITKGIESVDDSFDEMGYGQKNEVLILPQKVMLRNQSKQYGMPAFKGQSEIYPAVASSTAYGAIIRAEITDTTEDDSTYPTECVGLIVKASGAKPLTSNGLYGGNFAIQAESGMFAGLRPRFRRITSSDNLSPLDHTIECFREDGGNVWLALYADPEIGQCYEIWKWGSCVVHINGRTKTIVRIGVVEQLEHSIDEAFTGVIKLVYRGDNWLMTLHRTE